MVFKCNNGLEIKSTASIIHFPSYALTLSLVAGVGFEPTNVGLWNKHRTMTTLQSGEVLR